MIDFLRLRNFKSHEDTWLPLAPITLLMGANSSGKSSIFQALLVLKQSLERGPFQYRDLCCDGPRARLGGFSNVQRGHDPATNVGFDFHIRGRAYSLSYGQTATSEYIIGDDRNELHRMQTWSNEADYHGSPTWDSGEWPTEDGSDEMGLWLKGTGKERDRIDAARASTKDVASSYIRDANAALAEFVGVRHIGPTRRAGQRAYAIDRSTPDEVGTDGAHLATYLLRGDRLSRVNATLQQIGVPYRVTVADLSTLTRTVDLRLEDRFNVHIGIPDVGFGVSQLLPILAQWAGMLEAREEHALPGILLIEQPELHLHPAWQIGLVNAFAAPLNPQNSAPDVQERRKPQVVLETHAPVMVRAVQKLVREGDLKAADVSILVFDTPDDRGAARVQHVPLNSGGRFAVPWPNGFFPQEEELLYGRDS